MKVLYKIPAIVVCVNFFMWGIFQALFNDTKVRWIFYILRPEYMIISGPFSLVALIMAIILLREAMVPVIWKTINVLTILLNLLYLYLYFLFISVQ